MEDEMNGPDAGLTGNDRTWGMLCHLSTLSGFIGVPLGNIIAPLVIWLIKKDEMQYVDHHGKEALSFQITMFIYTLISAILILAIVGIVLIFVVLVADIVLTIIAAIKANNGEYYEYPMTIRFIK
jgi:uncharacterized protein